MWCARLANLALKTVCRPKSGILYPNRSTMASSTQTRNMSSLQVLLPVILSTWMVLNNWTRTEKVHSWVRLLSSRERYRPAWPSSEPERSRGDRASSSTPPRRKQTISNHYPIRCAAKRARARASRRRPWLGGQVLQCRFLPGSASRLNARGVTHH